MLRFMLCLFLGVLGILALPLEGIYSVKDYGAKGDGVTDDTEAIKKAVASAPEGAIVYFPPGRYRLTDTIEVRGKTLMGNPQGAWNSDADVLPTLLVDHMKGPAIHLYDGASLTGFCFQYEHKPTVPQKFPPTILLSGVGINISNLKIHGCYDGIIADGKSNVGRLKMRNIFIAQCHNIAIYITRTYDVATLDTIHIWSPASPTSLTQGIGIKLGRNDEIHLVNCFVFHTHTAYLFETDPGEGGGSTYGTFLNCATDYCSKGYLIKSPVKLNIVGGDFWNHHASLEIDDPGADVRVTGAFIQSNGEPCVILKNAKSLIITGSSFRSAIPRPQIFSVEAQKADKVVITGCDFTELGPGVNIGEDVRSAVITGNIFASKPDVACKVLSPRYIIRNNVNISQEEK